MAVKTGLEMLVSQGAPSLRGKSVGLVCHPASLGPGFAHAADLLRALPLVRLAALFGPEHGVRGEAQDMVAVEAGKAQVDEKTGARVYSLYGPRVESLKPTPAMLEGLDALVIDLQDVGSRYYTYYATMALCLQAAAEAGLAIHVLDRPNPLGGELVEGGGQEPGFESFVGPFPLPVRHGLTMGELALWANDRLDLDCDLTIIAMEGWERPMLWEQTGLPFIPPSPNMPTADTARVYPGTCLVEGTNLSEGRGTTRPFEQVGAPFLDPEPLAAALNRQRLPGVHFRPLRFTPTFHKFAAESCGGVFLHVTDQAAFRPYKTGLSLLMTAQDLARDQFRWRTETYEFVDGVPAIDLLTGTDLVRLSFDRGETLSELFQAWAAEEEEFRQERQPFLVY